MGEDAKVIAYVKEQAKVRAHVSKVLAETAPDLDVVGVEVDRDRVITLSSDILERVARQREELLQSFSAF